MFFIFLSTGTGEPFHLFSPAPIYHPSAQVFKETLRTFDTITETDFDVHVEAAKDDNRVSQKGGWNLGRVLSTYQFTRMGRVL